MPYLVLTDRLRSRHAVLRVGAPGEALMREADVVEWPSGAEHVEAIATDGRRLVMATRTGREGDVYTLTVRELATRATVFERSLSARNIAALSLRGDRSFIGEAGRVRVLTLGAAMDEPEVVASLPDRECKPYDHFAWCDDDLLAVDDMMAPIYADLLHAPSDGPVTLRSAFRFPDEIGFYEDVLLARDAAGAPLAFTLRRIATELGVGNEIVASPVASLPVRTAESMQRGSFFGRRFARAEEFVPDPIWKDAGEPKLLHGERLTDMHAIAFTHDRRALLAATSERGLLRITLPLGKRARVTALQTAQSCLDVIAFDGRRFALTGARDAETSVVLELDDEGTAIVHASTVQGRFERFVR